MLLLIDAYLVLSMHQFYSRWKYTLALRLIVLPFRIILQVISIQTLFENIAKM